MSLAKLFEVERIDGTLILNLRRGVENIECGDESPCVSELADFLRTQSIGYIVVDCHDVDFLRSTALGFFVTLWQRIKGRGGWMAFCNTSEKGRQVLAATKLARIWRIYGTREDVLAAIGDEGELSPSVEGVQRNSGTS
jgi:anti-anti-sigma factor